jgi:hypothetical protein
MKNSTSIVTFELPELRDHFKILSIDGKPRNSNTLVDCQKYTLVIESLYRGIPFNFTMDFLTEEEIRKKRRVIGYPIILMLEYGESSLKSKRFYSKKDDFLSDFNWYNLNEIIFTTFFNYFKETNKFKLLNTFY